MSHLAWHPASLHHILKFHASPGVPKLIGGHRGSRCGDRGVVRTWHVARRAAVPHVSVHCVGHTGLPGNAPHPSSRGTDRHIRVVGCKVGKVLRVLHLIRVHRRLGHAHTPVQRWVCHSGTHADTRPHVGSEVWVHGCRLGHAGTTHSWVHAHTRVLVAHLCHPVRVMHHAREGIHVTGRPHAPSWCHAATEIRTVETWHVHVVLGHGSLISTRHGSVLGHHLAKLMAVVRTGACRWCSLRKLLLHSMVHGPWAHRTTWLHWMVWEIAHLVAIWYVCFLFEDEERKERKQRKDHWLLHS